MNLSNIYFDKRQGKLNQNWGNNLQLFSKLRIQGVPKLVLTFQKFNTVLILNNLILTCTEKSCAYLDFTSNFLLENVYFDYGRVSNKKVIQLLIF